ncbi:DsbA family oxidoreductase [Methylobrevis pamukkalensis]|uniref:DSBA-like thioredoxin domain protein n=1 Tax=Methylobrevis pamukkalensis TaxID=1439726 RepID=A0A1E3H3C6_9HYPH|nr:DsbA family oxidoreductase [Methylobrevis pamukkalensis]ODN70829.1 DSBA-like thioredoxin domain protein [Methylobrevis pamukkalensis]
MTAAPYRPSLSVDVFLDVICPWCFVGKRHLDAAIDMIPDIDIAVRWRAFQLDPTIPKEGKDRRAYMLDKFRDPARIDEIHGKLTDIGMAIDIPFAFDRIAITPNTLDSHRLIRWAGAEDLGTAAVEGLCSAFFCEGRDLTDEATLAAIADEIGLDGDEIRDRLATDIDLEIIRAEIDYAGRIGITGVPCYVMGGRYAISGAQPPEMMADAFRRVAAELSTRAAE